MMGGRGGAAGPGALEGSGAGLPAEALLPGEMPKLRWAHLPDPAAVPLVDDSQLQGLAARALAAGDGRLTAVGIAAPQHGAGATTVARNLAICLAAQFGKRVVLVEANQRSPSLRRIYNLPESPGLSDVLSSRIGVGGALQIAGEHRRILMLPASLPIGVAQGALPSAEGLRRLLAALFGHADAVVVDLAPVIPYRDSVAMCGALDGVALVLRGGHSTVADGREAVRRIEAAGSVVLGAVLNRERRPRFLGRWRRAA
jgi:Mrp family chromosome partitioning ATPase